MLKRTGILVAVLLFLTSAGLAQDSDGRWDASISGGMAFSKQTSGNGSTQTPTQNFTFVGGLRLRIAKKSSLQINWGHTDNSQNYVANSLSYRVQDNVTEYSGAYVFRPMHTEKLYPFLLAGGGALVFNPNTETVDDNFATLPAVRQTETAFLYGGGVDYSVLSWVAVRVQYRGFIYTAPDFKVPGLFTGQRGHMAEPTIGVVIRF